MRNRILPIVNLLLILVCGWCIYYLATATYVRPREIAEAEKLLQGQAEQAGTGATTTESGHNPTGTETNPGIPQVDAPTATPTPGGEAPTMMKKDVFVAIWTPTPTPTPTPSPTPQPPNLRTAADSWDIVSIDGNKVEFVDKRSPGASETFVLEVGGPPRETVDSQNLPISIRVLSIDEDNNKVKLGYMDQTFDKPMFNQ